MHEIVKALSGINKEEWESLKNYVDYKIDTTGTIENKPLTIETLETFFFKIDD